MPFRFWCSGRTFPNSPAIGRVGCDRRAPMVVQVRWLHGIQPAYSPYDGVWMNCYFSGNETFGRDPVTNWNVDNAEQPGVHVNVRIQRRIHPSHPFELDILIGSGASGPDQFYTEVWQPWITWEDYLDAVDFPYIPGVEPPGPYIGDETVALRIGTYDRIPANTCKV